MKILSDIKPISYLKAHTADILKQINERKIIFLDIKDKRITAEDFKNICDQFDLEYWIAGYDLWYLGQLKSILKNYTFVYNFTFFNLKKGAEEAKSQGINIIKVFRWQLGANLKSHLLQSGLQFSIYPLFMKTKEYMKAVEKYGSAWIAYDDVRDLDKPYIGI